MVAKATLRIPVRLLDKLRERSRLEGRSLNETAVLAIERGLGGAGADEGWQALGTLLEVRPTAAYDPDELARLQADLGQDGRGLVDDLDWVRGDR